MISGIGRFSEEQTRELAKALKVGMGRDALEDWCRSTGEELDELLYTLVERKLLEQTDLIGGSSRNPRRSGPQDGRPRARPDASHNSNTKPLNSFMPIFLICSTCSG